MHVLISNMLMRGLHNRTSKLEQRSSELVFLIQRTISLRQKENYIRTTYVYTISYTSFTTIVTGKTKICPNKSLKNRINIESNV